MSTRTGLTTNRIEATVGDATSPADAIHGIDARPSRAELRNRFAVDWAPPEAVPADPTPGSRVHDPRLLAQHTLVLKGMANRFEGEFGAMFTRDTLHHYVHDSYAQMSATAKVVNHLPAFVERFARQRLRGLAKARGIVDTGRPEVLFICERNDAASQMAAGLLALHADGRAIAHSAGTVPAPELLAEAVAVMREVGVDLGDELPKPVTVEIERTADVIVTLDAHDDVAIIDTARHLAWRTESPRDEHLDGYRSLRNDLDRLVRDLLDEIAPGPAPTGRAFDDDLTTIEARVLDMGRAVITQLQQAGEALTTSDCADAAGVGAADDAVDAAHADIERRVVETIALRQPVAGDLRRLLTLWQTALHLERIGDGAVAIAGVVCTADGTRPDPRLVVQLVDMGNRVARMVDTVLIALETRDLDRCLDVAAQDEAVDDLQEQVFATLVTQAGDGVTRRWSLLADRIARSYERAGDHAVDIAEAVSFQITGEFREFHRDR